MIKSFKCQHTQALFEGESPKSLRAIQVIAERKLQLMDSAVTMDNQMRPVHPGEILREDYLQPLEMSANALAIALRVSAPKINDIVREKRAITPDTALRLARYFGGDAQTWLNLQSAYELKLSQKAIAEDLKNIIPLVA